MSRVRFTTFVAVTMLLLAHCVSGWAAPQVSVIGLSSFNASDYPNISILASVTDDATGATVKGLKPDDFTVTIDDDVQSDASIESVLSGGRKIAMVLLVDTSGSMNGEPLMSAKQAISDLLKRLSYKDEVLVAGFSNRVNSGDRFATEQAQLQSQIAALRSGGGTALYDAVAYACERVARKDTDRKVVILLSDGRDTSSSIAYAECLRRSKSSGSPVYAIGLGREIEEARLKEIASQTGGHYYAAATPADLQSIYQSIAADLENQYVVLLKAPNSLTPGTWHHLGVAVGDASAKVGFVVPQMSVKGASGSNEAGAGDQYFLAIVVIAVLVAMNLVGIGIYLARRRRSRRTVR